MTNHAFVIAGLGIWAIWGLSWLAAGLWAGRSVGRAGIGRYGIQLGIAFLGFGLLFSGRPAPVHPLWLLPPWLGWAMVGLIAAGFAFAWWARIHLGALWSMAIIRREGHRIVDSGPYALVRHPIYTALIVAATGLATVKATPMAIAGAVLITLGFTLKARIEEAYLGAELGHDAYAAYRRRVPMLIPFLRPSS
jgi:protein-S-isoprenylcysteine O-methyltransferase Ste14